MRSTILFAIAAVGFAAQPLTCNSGIKVTHKQTGFHLTSSDINWGSGSGQQSVTATSSNGDSTALWMIVEGDGADTCPPGEVITCSSEIRFTHVVTGKNLHSHRFRSPLTQEQEVSAFGEDGKGDPSDNWRVVCQSKGDWQTDTPFHLQHVETGQWLVSSNQARFNQQNCPNCPIVGQLEVVATKNKSDMGLWVVQRGAFLQDNSL